MVEVTEEAKEESKEDEKESKEAEKTPQKKEEKKKAHHLFPPVKWLSTVNTLIKGRSSPGEKISHWWLINIQAGDI